MTERNAKLTVPLARLKLQQKHCVPEGVEAVFLGYGLGVGAVDEVFSREGGDEHQQGGPG